MHTELFDMAQAAPSNEALPGCLKVDAEASSTRPSHARCLVLSQMARCRSVVSLLLRHPFLFAKVAPPCHASPSAAPCHPYQCPVFAPRPRSVLTFPSCPACPARGAPRQPGPKDYGPYLAAAAHAQGASTSVSDSREHAPLAGWLQ